ncbi:UDP-N-acetyl-D-mannosamine 6-dehydrogenase [Fusarium agapanthi]|uniref:UDP-N-acetyl-D-mannosamine 6-dehydrogenase n=1 Tax=Fusarium agapanthi TaxID=1803897 RepID=A0A9P5EAN1_9HYPO|nr:UDP-N-acetyl-D-mannosamine 6-dehydrogenase [Fusarium agapanthi]
MPHKIEQPALEGNQVLAAKQDILVAVIGIGFVGTGLVSTFSTAYSVLRFDVGQNLRVGGHCIPVNPYYLLLNNDFPLLLQQASDRMHQRPKRIALRILDELHAEEHQSDPGILVPKRVLIVGIGFKAGQSHLVNSPGLALASELQRLGQVDVMFADSLVCQSQVPHLEKFPGERWNKECLGGFDMIVVAFRQVAIELEVLKGLRGVKLQMWCD